MSWKQRYLNAIGIGSIVKYKNGDNVYKVTFIKDNHCTIKILTSVHPYIYATTLDRLEITTL